jgi:very-short-patch-repair endonuclease
MANKVDMEIGRVAGRQHGVVASWQLRAAGLGRSAVSGRVASGRLYRLHQGVYGVGSPVASMEARWMAAVLACGDGAVLSHRSAAVHWGLVRPRGGPVDVSIPSSAGRRRRAGIRLHRSSSMQAAETTRRAGIPITTPARTIADLKRTAPAWEVRRATRQAEFLKLPLGPELRTDGSRSDLETDFLRLCRRHGIPRPEVNAKVGPFTVDFLWRHERVAVETDFYDYHRGREAFRDDHARDLELRRRGLAVRRYSEEQVNGHSAAVMADLRDALGPAS